MSSQSYTVTGMTCGHCVSSVTEEVESLAGVTDVEVDLDSGRLTVTSERQVPEEAIRGVVEEAGYRLVAGQH